eukprot:TRINITY_DN394_c0_g1_i2.p1 TRINITY_DN394_c0_g1~~TRINITY_DN394_c0_g1_i2.p1  ORF type:complete len:473 (-),score=120.64 TRINITY_DN394_c0_g1_i2:121-1539(-)
MATNLTNCAGSTEQLQAQVIHDGPHPLSNGDFDLGAYASYYTGHSKTIRLRHIADNCPQLADDALRQLAAALEQNGNMKDYADLLSSGHKHRLGQLGLDKGAWVADTRRNSNVVIGKLEHALRESGESHSAAREAYIALGDQYYQIGELTTAKKDYYQHALEHGCGADVDAVQYRQWCLKMVKTSLNNVGGSFNMNDHLSKAKIGAGVALGSMMEASRGLSSLVQAARGLRGGISASHDSHIRAAGESFRKTTVDMDYNFSEVVVPQDVAAYGGLCALATMDREQIKKHLIQSRSFKKLLSLVPLVESIVHDFFNSRYSSMLNSMGQLRPVLELDVYFSGVVNRIFSCITSRAMIQFVSPYAVVKLPEMASIFQTNQKHLQNELRELILANKIEARIDSRNNSLVASSKTIRTDAFDMAMQAGDDIEDALVRMLLTKSVLKDELIPEDPRKKDRGMGGMGGMMGSMMGMGMM